MSDTTTAVLTAALREAADLLAAVTVPHDPYITSHSDGTVSLAWYLNLAHYSGSDLARQRTDAAAIVRALGGAWAKHEGDIGGHFYYEQARGLLEMRVQVERAAVCERVVIGTETVMVPAQEAQPATEAHTVEREVVEWRCEPLLAQAAAQVQPETVAGA